ncbi:MAG: STAS domain-containing protein [Planctomycetota bacterium]
MNLRPIPSDPSAVVGELVGVIDGTTVAGFQTSLEDLLKRNTPKLILDMQRVRYVNSTGLGAIVQYADKFKAQGGGIALIKVTAKVRIVIEMLGLQAFFEICNDEAAGLQALSKNAGPAPAPVGSGSGSGRLAPPPPPAPAAVPASSGASPNRAGRTIPCQGCQIDLEIPAPGHWKCPRCRTLVVFSPGGKIEFQAPGGAPRFELSIPSTPEGTDALTQFVGVVAQQSLNGGQKIAMLKAAVGEVAYVITSTIYEGNVQRVYNVLVETHPQSVKVQFADHGKPLASNAVSTSFPNAARGTTEFECRPHPKGGNIIKFTVAQ